MHNKCEGDVVAPIMWVLEKLCKRFPKFDAWLESILTVKPGNSGTGSLGPK
jgi:hypothetical protein